MFVETAFVVVTYIVLSLGNFQWHQGFDIAIETFSKLKDAVPNAELHLYGNGGTESKLVRLAESLNLNGRVTFCGGVPVVVSRTKIDSYYFDEGVVHFFPSGDSQALADAMLDVIENQTLRETLVTNGLEYAQANNWDQKKDEYLKLVDFMTTQAVEDLEQAT